jgi:predicted thioesterase
MGKSTERRRTPRVRRRLRVVFEHDPRRPAFTTNLSRDGLCISSDWVSEVGSAVSGALVLPDGQKVNFEAEVRWVRKARGRDLQDKNTMGIEFAIPPGETYDGLLGPEALQENPSAVAAAAPATAAPQPAAPVPVEAAPAAPAGSPVGMAHRIQTVVADGDLADPSGTCPCALSPARAAAWVEEASRRAVLAALGPGSVNIGVELSVNVSHGVPLAVGTPVAITVQISEASPDGRMLTFEAQIDDGQRVIVKARHRRWLYA